VEAQLLVNVVRSVVNVIGAEAEEEVAGADQDVLPPQVVDEGIRIGVNTGTVHFNENWSSGGPPREVHPIRVSVGLGHLKLA